MIEDTTNDIQRYVIDSDAWLVNCVNVQQVNTWY